MQTKTPDELRKEFEIFRELVKTLDILSKHLLDTDKHLSLASDFDLKFAYITYFDAFFGNI